MVWPWSSAAARLPRRPGANAPRSMSRSLSKVEGRVHGHEKASKKLAFLQVLDSATTRRYAMLLLGLTRDKVCDIERRVFEPER